MKFRVLIAIVGMGALFAATPAALGRMAGPKFDTARQALAAEVAPSVAGPVTPYPWSVPDRAPSAIAADLSTAGTLHPDGRMVYPLRPAPGVLPKVLAADRLGDTRESGRHCVQALELAAAWARVNGLQGLRRGAELTAQALTLCDGARSLPQNLPWAELAAGVRALEKQAPALWDAVQTTNLALQRQRFTAWIPGEPWPMVMHDCGTPLPTVNKIMSSAGSNLKRWIFDAQVPNPPLAPEDLDDLYSRDIAHAPLLNSTVRATAQQWLDLQADFGSLKTAVDAKAPLAAVSALGPGRVREGFSKMFGVSEAVAPGFTLLENGRDAVLAELHRREQVAAVAASFDAQALKEGLR